MYRFFAPLVAAVFVVTPASAQTATAVGTGVSNSTALSKSQATAIGGGQGIGVGGRSSATSNGASVNITNPAATTSTVNQTGGTSLRNVPTEFAPGLAAAGLETCLGSVSGGGAAMGWGASFGTTIPDPGCNARLDSRTLWAMGLKKAAIIRLCLMPDIYRSMPEVCQQYMPQYAYAGYAGPVEPNQVEADYTGGPVEVVERKTGLTRTCNDFDVTRHRCRVWAH